MARQSSRGSSLRYEAQTEMAQQQGADLEQEYEAGPAVR